MPVSGLPVPGLSGVDASGKVDAGDAGEEGAGACTLPAGSPCSAGGAHIDHGSNDPGRVPVYRPPPNESDCRYYVLGWTGDVWIEVPDVWDVWELEPDGDWHAPELGIGDQVLPSEQGPPESGELGSGGSAYSDDGSNDSECVAVELHSKRRRLDSDDGSNDSGCVAVEQWKRRRLDAERGAICDEIIAEASPARAEASAASPSAAPASAGVLRCTRSPDAAWRAREAAWPDLVEAVDTESGPTFVVAASAPPGAIRGLLTDIFKKHNP